MTHLGLTGRRALREGSRPARGVLRFRSQASKPQTIEKGFATPWVPDQHNSSLCAYQKRIADTIEIATPPEPREDTPLKLVFSVEDIARATRACCGAGRSRECDGGGSGNSKAPGFCDGHDPEGNIFSA